MDHKIFVTRLSALASDGHIENLRRPDSTVHLRAMQEHMTIFHELLRHYVMNDNSIIPRMKQDYCHGVTARYIAQNGKAHKDYKVVILGAAAPTVYRVVHSMVVGPGDTDRAADSFDEGHFLEGIYRCRKSIDSKEGSDWPLVPYYVTTVGACIDWAATTAEPKNWPKGTSFKASL